MISWTCETYKSVFLKVGDDVHFSLKVSCLWWISSPRSSVNRYLGGGFKYFCFHPYLGKIPILTNIFQMGWNHQPVMNPHFPSTSAGVTTSFGSTGEKLVVRNCWASLNFMSTFTIWARSVALEVLRCLWYSSVNPIFFAQLEFHLDFAQLEFHWNLQEIPPCMVGFFCCFFPWRATPGDILGRSKKRVRGRRKHGGLGPWERKTRFFFPGWRDSFPKITVWWKRSCTSCNMVNTWIYLWFWWYHLQMGWFPSNYRVIPIPDLLIDPQTSGLSPLHHFKGTRFHHPKKVSSRILRQLLLCYLIICRDLKPFWGWWVSEWKVTRTQWLSVGDLHQR